MKKGFAPILVIVVLSLIIPVSYFVNKQFLHWTIDKKPTDVDDCCQPTTENFTQLQTPQTTPTPLIASTSPTAQTQNSTTLTSNPLSGWKTYTSSKFSLKYPSKYIVVESADSPGFFWIKTNDAIQKDMYIIDTTFKDLNRDYTSAVDNYKAYLENPKVEELLGGVKISGLSKKNLSYTGTQLNIMGALYNYKGGAVIFEDFGDKGVENLKEYNLLLSTFKLIE